MEKLTRYFVQRPLAVNILMLMVLLGGVQTIINMQKEGFPAVSENRILITSIYPGASAKDVELNVTIKIEEELENIANVKEVNSVSREGMSTLFVIADDDLSPEQFSTFYDDVGSALSGLSDLPTDLDGPRYSQITSDDFPIIEIAISGDLTKLREFIPFLAYEIRRVPGVSQIDKIGFPDDEYHILVDPKKADRSYIDLRQIASAIGHRNVEGSGGTLESYISEKKVVVYNKFETPEAILETNIRRSNDKYGIRLNDVSEIKKTTENLNMRVRNDGESGVSLVIKRKPNADLLDTVDEIRKVIASIDTPEGITINLMNDQSVLTRDRLKLLAVNAGMGVLLVFLILAAVLGLKTAMWTAFSIPFSLLGMVIFLPFLGITLNSIALGGFVLVLGMLVDDAIVVAEQIAQEREQQKSPANAAVDAVKKVWKPVLGSSLTTVTAYYPISQMGGLPGKFVWMFPVIVGLALMMSLLDTYFLLPSHLSHGRQPKLPEENGPGWLERLYELTLKSARKFRYGVVVLFILLLGSAGYIASNVLTKDPFPQDAAEGFTIQLAQRSGISFDKAQENISLLEHTLLTLPDGELSGMSVRLGTQSKAADTDRGSEANLGMVFVYLKPFSERDRNAAQIMKDVEDQVSTEFAEKEIEAVFELIRIGPPVGRPFEIRISALDDILRTDTMETIKQFLSGTTGVLGVQDDSVEGKTELNLKVDQDKVAQAGLTVEDILTVVRIAYDGIVVSDIVTNYRTANYRLRLNEAARGDEQFLGSLGVMNERGNLVRLQEFVSLEENPALSEIRHTNGLRTSTVFGQLDKTRISPGDIESLVNKQFQSSKDVQISFAGEPVENRKIFGDLATAGITAILGVFLIISLILNSPATALIVMSAIPFGVVGVIYAAYLHGMPISLFVMISVIGLSGVIVNDSLVMVFTIKELAIDGLLTIERIMEGALQRVRPVLLTTVTTVSGLLPTAYSLGGHDPFISPMCLALAYGLMFGTFVILILVPVLYMIGVDLHTLKSRIV